MEEECQEESSFEILTISDDDDMLTASMYSSIESSTFESLNSFYFLESITSEAETKTIQETNCCTSEKQTFGDNDTKSDPLIETFENCGDSLNQVFSHEKSLSWLDEISFNKVIPSTGECQINCTAKNPDATEVKGSTWFSEIIEETIQSINALNEFPPTTENCVSNLGHVTYAVDIEQTQSDSTTCGQFAPKANSSKLYAAENSASQIPPDRHEDLPSCSFMKHGLHACRSINGNFQNLVSGIKSSFHKLRNKFELEMNLMMGMNDPLNIVIIGEISDSSAIEEVFYQSLSGQVVVSKYPEEKGTNVPILPVGYNSAMTTVQSKINQARLLHAYENNAVIVCTTTFISEVYPQRWQLCTMLCLEDPNLSLHLHNFTSTIPVPNDYLLQAQRLTSNDYQFKNMGLAVSLEQAIGCTIDNMDLEEKLCGVHHLVNLKSAAKILAGMYSKTRLRIGSFGSVDELPYHKLDADFECE